MCGRYGLSQTRKQIEQAFEGLTVDFDLPRRYNIGPGQPVLGVAPAKDRKSLKAGWFDWGFELKPEKGPFCINARCETIFEKRRFSPSVRQRRCLLLADGFFEWEHRNQQKIPHLFRLKTQEIFGLAAIWEKANTQNERPRCVVLTTRANDLVSPLHHRMPIILRGTQMNRWINSAAEITNQWWTEPLESDLMTTLSVSQQVNNIHFDAPECYQQGSLGEQTSF